MYRFVRFKPRELGKASVGEATVRLLANIEGHAGGNEVKIEQSCAFAVEFLESSIHEILNEWSRPLQDLLALALGRSVRLTAFYLRPKGANRDQPFGRVFLQATQPAPGPKPDWVNVMSYTAPTLFTFRDLPISFDELIPNWFELRSTRLEAIVLLHAEYYAGFMFNEHRYASVFQSAEALAHACGLSGREKTRSEHKARVDAILKAAREAGVENQSLAWAERILRSRNDKTLAQQIEDLVKATGRVGEKILIAEPNFGRMVASARTGVSHGGAQDSASAIDRHWYGDVLRWVIRATLTKDLGLGLVVVEERVSSRAGFQYALDRVKEATKATDRPKP